MQNFTDARSLLDAIDAFLSDPNVPEQERAGLWDVLTALRGPEGKDDCPERKAVKEAVTGVIRANAFPRTAFLGINERPNRAIFTLRRLADFAQTKKGHFRFHCLQACSFLGIETKNVA